MNRSLVVSLLALLLGCQRQESVVLVSGTPQSLATTTVLIANRPFVLEVADDEAERDKGLMFRDSMPGDHGMLFVFPDEKERDFWMKNTHIPLDILYLDHDGAVVSVSTMKAFDLTAVPSHGAAKYAIELNAGIAGAIGIKPGDRVAIPASVTHG